MKMLANVGGGRGEEAAGNLDDGIRTGWICCTIGRIEAHPEDTHVPGVSGQENFVGFRDVKPGVNVVVQMFTEEKRAEIDLETLWDGVLKTHERKDAVAEEQLRELEEKLDEDVVREAAEREARRKAEVLRMLLQRRQHRHQCQLRLRLRSRAMPQFPGPGIGAPYSLLRPRSPPPDRSADCTLWASTTGACKIDVDIDIDIPT
jgi:hypothetical protein